MAYLTPLGRLRRAQHWVGAVLLGTPLTFASCSYDEEERCGDELVLRNNVCVCPEGAVLVESACVTCAENEIVQSGSCACSEGYVRPTPEAACEAEDSSAGAGGEGGDSGSNSGSGGDSEGPPDGLGQSCESAADCAGTEAEYCDTFMTNMCLVEGCNVDPDDCYEGYECCDLSTFGLGTLCVPAGNCPT